MLRRTKPQLLSAGLRAQSRTLPGRDAYSKKAEEKNLGPSHDPSPPKPGQYKSLIPYQLGPLFRFSLPTRPPWPSIIDPFQCVYLFATCRLELLNREELEKSGIFWALFQLRPELSIASVCRHRPTRPTHARPSLFDHGPSRPRAFSHQGFVKLETCGCGTFRGPPLLRCGLLT